MNTSTFYRPVALIKSDFRRVCRQTCPIAFVLWTCLILINLGAKRLFGMDIQAEDRHIIILIMSFVFCISIPSLGFYNINHDRNDLISVLLPLKRNHKFLSMILTGSIMIPFLFMLATYFLDAFMQPQLLPSASPSTMLKDALTLFLAQSVFVLGNILFKRHKLGYSVICMLILMSIMTFLGDLISGLETSPEALTIIHNLMFRYVIPIVLYLLSLERFINLEI